MGGSKAGAAPGNETAPPGAISTRRGPARSVPPSASRTNTPFRAPRGRPVVTPWPVSTVCAATDDPDAPITTASRAKKTLRIIGP